MRAFATNSTPLHFLPNGKRMSISLRELCVIIHTKHIYMKKDIGSYTWLLAGAFFMLFSNGRWMLSFAAWTYSIFFLRFLRLHKPAWGFLVLMVTIAMINPVIFWKVIPGPIYAYLLLSCLALQLTTLSFLADRLLATRFNGFISTLIFPAAWCGIEYAMSLIPSKGTWNVLAYTQTGNLYLMQLASVTGVWGISFLITWFASIVNWIWSQKFEWNKIRKGVIAFTFVFAGATIASALFPISCLLIICVIPYTHN